jgi:DnaJ-domain-containing protein 1
LYQFAESKGARQFVRKKKTETNQTYAQKDNQQNTTNQNTTTRQETKPTTPQYTEQYVKACSLFELKPTFSESELKTSYHKMMKQYHPDLYATAAPEIKDFVEEKSRELIASYNYLLELGK